MSIRSLRRLCLFATNSFSAKFRMDNLLKHHRCPTQASSVEWGTKQSPHTIRVPHVRPFGRGISTLRPLTMRHSEMGPQERHFVPGAGRIPAMLRPPNDVRSFSHPASPHTSCMKGTGFSPYINATMRKGALAPEGHLAIPSQHTLQPLRESAPASS